MWNVPAKQGWEKKKRQEGERGVQQKKYSAYGEDSKDSSGVLCEVSLEPMLFEYLMCCGG